MPTNLPSPASNEFDPLDSRILFDPEIIKEFQEQIQYSFRSIKILQNALTHRSVKTSESPSNERLEFLGDSVLGLIASETVYQSYPNLQEGEMTALKATWVSTNSLATVMRHKKWERYFFLGKGILQTGEIPESVLANGFEAVLAAIYLDGGLIFARKFALDFLLKECLKNYENFQTHNYKTLLQQFTQVHFSMLPEYRVLSASGPDHQREYRISVIIEGTTYPPGIGRSKKEAEQMAAQIALETLNLSP
ncbi:MAG: ribonuclease III [Planctomycetota bacterium]